MGWYVAYEELGFFELDALIHLWAWGKTPNAPVQPLAGSLI